MIDSNCASSCQKHYHCQHHHHHRRHCCCCCRMHCKHEDTCLPSLYFVLMRNVYTQHVYRKHTHTGQRQRQSCAFFYITCLYRSIPQMEMEKEIQLNGIQRVYAHSIYFQRAESFQRSPHNTHKHTYIISSLHTSIPSNYIFSFFFFFWVFSFPLLVYS